MVNEGVYWDTPGRHCLLPSSMVKNHQARLRLDRQVVDLQQQSDGRPRQEFHETPEVRLVNRCTHDGSMGLVYEYLHVSHYVT